MPTATNHTVEGSGTTETLAISIGPDVPPFCKKPSVTLMRLLSMNKSSISENA